MRKEIKSEFWFYLEIIAFCWIFVKEIFERRKNDRDLTTRNIVFESFAFVQNISLAEDGYITMVMRDLTLEDSSVLTTGCVKFQKLW